MEESTVDAGELLADVVDDDVEETVEETKEDVDVSALVELIEFEVGSEEEEEEEEDGEELLDAAWLVVKDVLEM